MMPTGPFVSAGPNPTNGAGRCVHDGHGVLVTTSAGPMSVSVGNSDDDEDGEPHCPGGSAGPEDTMELESNTEFHRIFKFLPLALLITNYLRYCL